MAKSNDVIDIPAEPKLWQVRFGHRDKQGNAVLNGHGQQVEAATEADVRKEMAKVYGEDYEILEVFPLS